MTPPEGRALPLFFITIPANALKSSNKKELCCEKTYSTSIHATSPISNYRPCVE